MKPYKFGASFCRFNNQMKCNYIFKTFVFKNCGKVLIIKKSAVSFEHFKCEHVERNNNNNYPTAPLKAVNSNSRK